MSTSGPDPAELRGETLAWIKVATADLRAATLCIASDPPLRDVAAFHCQQAAEKLLKGFLVSLNHDFGKTHDLEKLGHTVSLLFPFTAELVAPMRAWTAWSVAYRYPSEAGGEPEPSVDELNQALALIGKLESALQSVALGA